MGAPDGIACRLMRPEDWPALLALWQDTFGDAPRYASHCIDTFAGEDNVLVAQNRDGVAIAQLLAVPCTLGESKGVYLYALATRPDYRAQGVMAALMEESDRLAFWRGAAFSVLIPASGPLYGYYRRHGYGNTLYLWHLSVEDAPYGAAAVKVDIPTEEGLARLRQRFLPVPTVAFAGPRAALVAKDLADADAFVAEGKNGYAVARPQNGTLYVAELAAESDGAAKGILAAALKEAGCAKARVTLAASSPLFAGQGSPKPAAVLKALDEDFRFDEDTYLRFAMDEAFRFDLPGG